MRLRLVGVCGAVLSLAAGGLAGVGVPSAVAVTAPVGLSAGALPAWQTNGIVWAMAQAGGVVFAGGTFSAVRPPGAAAGSGERPAVNFVALDAATGVPTSCRLSFTVGSGLATVRALAVSPDGGTLYAGGRFGAVNGVKTSNVAAIDIRRCAPKAGFKVSVNATVRALDVTGDAVYLGGDFTKVAGQARRYFASVTTSGALRPWTADADEVGRTLKVTPDGKNVILGGDFFHLNGADSHALAVVNSTTGALTKTYPLGFFPHAMAKGTSGWEPDTRVKDITTDATGFYIANEGWFDGRTAFSLKDFTMRWRDDCFGATQAVEVYKGVLYSASHAQDCHLMGEFPRGPRKHLLAESVNDPKLLGWSPNTNDGIGEQIGPRVLTTASKNGTDYLWVGGEFTTVNDTPQQGLTRFSSGADTTAPSAPQVSAGSTTPGRIDVHWRSSLDLDDSALTYRIYRNGSHTPLHTVTGTSLRWKRPQLTFTDTHVTPGATYTYRITASDGTNTSVMSQPVKVTAARTANRYARRVVADGASLYWRFEETSGSFAADSSGTDNGGVHRGAPACGITPGAVPGSHAAIGYRGVDPKQPTAPEDTAGDYTYSERPISRPKTFSIETWFKTTTTSGGKLVGFGDRQERPSVLYDDHVYLTDDGRVVFGVVNNPTLSSGPGLNNGTWHHVVATQSPQGMRLYVDGHLQATNTAAPSLMDYTGYWHVGGDSVKQWPTAPSSPYFTGQIDETAIYPSVLSPAQVAQHYSLGTHGVSR
ncbi:LamG-like jellyroll fold domain-containing protein [Streptomyces sp. L2]|uniref:LamG domain-containing protein n=1 Tax=Streptomyces sp. L2 TaxID=2162665 RepID=UPI001F5102E6|nr:LamG-like jellyroll fold domain-containing protein [Streptomyces sp. L2]